MNERLSKSLVFSRNLRTKRSAITRSLFHLSMPVCLSACLSVCDAREPCKPNNTASSCLILFISYHLINQEHMSVLKSRKYSQSQWFLMGWDTEKNTENYLVCYLEILKLYVNLHASLQAFDWLAKLSSMTCDGGDKWDGGGRWNCKYWKMQVWKIEIQTGKICNGGKYKYGKIKYEWTGPVL